MTNIKKKLTFLSFHGLGKLSPSELELLDSVLRGVPDESILPLTLKDSFSFIHLKVFGLHLLVFPELTLKEFMF